MQSVARPRGTARTVFLVVGALLATLAVLPLLIGVAFFTRLAGPVIIVGGVIAVLASRRVREWLSFEERGEAPHAGVILPMNVWLHRQHAWASRVDKRRVHAGIDHIMQRALGPVTRVEAPPVGTAVRQGQVLFTVSSGDGRTVHARAPVSGTVLRVNPIVETNPGLLSLDPYDSGWVVELDAPRFVAERNSLVRQQSAWSFLGRELDRMLGLIRPRAAAAGIVHDGGDPARDLYRLIDEPTWQRIDHELFGGPATS